MQTLYMFFIQLLLRVQLQLVIPYIIYLSVLLQVLRLSNYLDKLYMKNFTETIFDPSSNLYTPDVRSYTHQFTANVDQQYRYNKQFATPTIRFIYIYIYIHSTYAHTWYLYTHTQYLYKDTYNTLLGMTCSLDTTKNKPSHLLSRNSIVLFRTIARSSCVKCEVKCRCVCRCVCARVYCYRCVCACADASVQVCVCV